MANGIPPAPIRDPFGSYTWEEWFRKMRDRALASVTSVTWSGIDFTGSNITSILTRNHNDLTTIQGGTSAEYYHLTDSQHTNLTDGGETTLHKHVHNNMDTLQGGTTSEYYHLTSAQHTGLTGFIGATPSASAATTTHKVAVTLNGSTYYILLSDV